MSRKRKWTLLVCIIFTISLIGCSFKDNLAVEQNNGLSTSALFVQEKIPLLKTMDATSLRCIEPYDKNIIYLTASKKDGKQMGQEFVYATYSLSTKEIIPIHREVVSSDGIKNTDVYQVSEHKTKFFTGQQLFTLENNKVININNITGDKYSVSVNLQNDTMVYIDKEPPSIFYKSINDKNGNEIIKSKEIEAEGKKSILFPYLAQLNKEGNKIIYGKAIDSAGLYQTVCICSTDGTLLAETNQLDINADYLDVLWYDDGFITIETTDCYISSPTGLATILTKYNENAEETNRTVLHGVASNYQREFFPNMPLFAFSYQTDSTNGLAIWDAETGSAYYVCDMDGYNLSPTITPEGEKLLWLNDDSLYVENIDLDRYEKIPIY